MDEKEITGMISSVKQRHCKNVSFRELVGDIHSTTYASHGMYYYPAKFIPQVVSWFIRMYSEEGDWIIDPYCGAGTLAVECMINKRNAICLDLNPVIEPLISAKTRISLDYSEVIGQLSRIMNGSEPFKPKWSRISYWYEPRIMRVIQNMWEAYYKEPHPLTLLALFKTSRRFSYADDQVPKIFISKRKRREVEEVFLKKDYEKLIKEYFRKSLEKEYRGSLEFASCYQGGDCIVKGGVDLTSFKLDRDVDHLITSPPYGRAHEYIRSFKLELAWMGYTDSEITNLIRKEIPYRRDIPSVEVKSDTYERFRDIVPQRFLRDYECYFKSVIAGLNNVMERVRGYAGIFVGNATYGGVEPKYHDIFIEHFENNGFSHEITLVDKIVSRRLFKGRRNLSPEGIDVEYLVILKSNNKVKSGRKVFNIKNDVSRQERLKVG